MMARVGAKAFTSHTFQERSGSLSPLVCLLRTYAILSSGEEETLFCFDKVFIALRFKGN